MSIKSYLRTLFKMSGSQSAPDTGAIVDISITGGVDATTYVAPEDGYVGIAAEADGLIRVQATNQMESASNAQTVRQSFSGWTRVKKGDTVLFSVENPVSVYWARFVRTVGGGVKSLCRNTLSGGVNHVFA